MGLVQMLAAEIVGCAQAGDCLNSKENRGGQSQCQYCRFAASGGGPADMWRPWLKGTPHPQQLAEKKQASRDRLEQASAMRLGKSRDKQALLKKAARAEKLTTRNYNSSMLDTVNSGRSHKDGDHVLANKVTLDTKLQSGNSNPVVNLAELDKVQEDAKRGGNVLGGLVLRNKHDRGVIVFDEQAYAVWFTRMFKEKFGD